MTEVKQKQNIFLFHGDDTHTIAKKVAAWKELFEKKYGKQTVSIIDAASDDWTEDELLGICKKSVSSQSLFASESFVIVKNIFSDAAYRERLGSFFVDSAPKLTPSTFLLFVERRIDKRLSLYKSFCDLEKGGLLKIENFSIPRGAELAQWIKQEIKRLKSLIADDALQLFVQRYDPVRAYSSRQSDEVQYDLWLLSSELHKLALYASGRRIERSDVELLCPMRSQSHVFDLIAALLKRDTHSSIVKAHVLLAQQDSRDNSSVLGLCSFLQNQLRDMLIVQDMLKQKRSEQQIAHALQWQKVERVRIVARQVRSITADFFKNALLMLIDLERSLKSRPLQPQSAFFYTLARILELK